MAGTAALFSCIGNLIFDTNVDDFLMIAIKLILLFPKLSKIYFFLLLCETLLFLKALGCGYREIKTLRIVSYHATTKRKKTKNASARALIHRGVLPISYGMVQWENGVQN